LKDKFGDTSASKLRRLTIKFNKVPKSNYDAASSEDVKADM